jgi:hypothetical protein
MRVQFFMLAPVVIRVGDLDQRGLGLKGRARAKRRGSKGTLFSFLNLFSSGVDLKP